MSRADYVSPEGLRRDGRRPREVRRLKCQINVLGSADGSAIFEMGYTKVLAAVFGPREAAVRSQGQVDRAILKCEYAMAAFSTGSRRRRGKTDRRSTELSLVIKNTLEQTVMLELLPHSQIDVFVQVLQADGGTRCACINAALLALADAGIPLRDLLGSCAAGYLQGHALLDLNYEEDSADGPDIAVAYQPHRERIVLLQMDSKLPTDEFDECVQLAVEGCKVVSEFMREQLLQYTKQLVMAKGALPQLHT